MKNVLRYIGVYFSKPIWSFIRNCVFWLFRLNKVGAAKKKMEAFMDTKKLKEEIKLLERKIELMEKYLALQKAVDDYQRLVPIYPSVPGVWIGTPTITTGGPSTTDTTCVLDSDQMSFN